MITSNRHQDWPEFPLKSPAPPPGQKTKLGETVSEALAKSSQFVQQTFSGIPYSYLMTAFAAGLVVGWIVKRPK